MEEWKERYRERWAVEFIMKGKSVVWESNYRISYMREGVCDKNNNKKLFQEERKEENTTI